MKDEHLDFKERSYSHNVEGAAFISPYYIPKVTSEKQSINLEKQKGTESDLSSSMISTFKGIEDEKPEDIKDRKMLLFSILISLFFIQTVNTNVTTMVPNYCEKYHPTLTTIQVAFIMTYDAFI